MFLIISAKTLFFIGYTNPGKIKVGKSWIFQKLGRQVKKVGKSWIFRKLGREVKKSWKKWEKVWYSN